MPGLTLVDLPQDKVENLNVLLIEDNADDVELLEHHLHAVKHRKILLEHVEILSAGLNRLSKGGVDLVFLDLSLPDSSGIETLVRAHSEDPGVPIIILTGSNDDDLAVRALRHGAQDFLVKGQFDSSSLGRSINYALERQRGAIASGWISAVVESTTDAIVGSSLENVIISWNRGAELMYGYEAAEVLGKPMEILLPPDCPNDMRPVVERIKRGEKVEVYETSRCRKDGSLITLSLAIAAIRNAEGWITGVSSIARDVTEKLLSEKSLRQSEQRLRLAIEASKLGIWFWDPHTGELQWDDRMCEMFGVTRAQFRATHEAFLELVHGQDRDRVRESLQSALTEDAHYHCEYRVLWSDGTTRDIEATGELVLGQGGEPKRMAGVCLDITERKKTEQKGREAFKQQEQITSAIVQHAPVGIIRLDFNLVVTDVNSAFATMIHREKVQLLNQPLAKILPDKIYRTMLETIGSGNPLRVFRIEATIPNDRPEVRRHWDMSMWPVAGDEGQLQGAVLQILDCTDSVILQRQREDFVAAVAHDIKNPLIGAERVFSLLCNQAAHVSPESHAQMLAVLRDSNLNLLSMVQNLVDVYRYETLAYPIHCCENDLKKLIASCISQMGFFAASRGISMRSKAPDSLESIQVDEMAIRRVLMNILHNAVKFNKHGGVVEVFVEQSDGTVRIDITDTGDGISNYDQQKLFQRYSQGEAGEKSTSGSGLGLYLSKQIVLAHHGSIACSSSNSNGSTFSISLPLTQPPVVEGKSWPPGILGI
jgi:PAS domain S-box-containing protein